MPDSWQGYPVGVAFLILFCIVMLRGQGTYWLARWITAAAVRHTLPRQGWKARVHGWLRTHVEGRGTGILDRYGILAIPVVHLTVGLQTVILAAAGVLRIGWVRFTIAQALGGLAWATIYTTIGFAVWSAALGAAVRNPWVILVLGLTVAGLVIHLVRRRRTDPAVLTPPTPREHAHG